MFCDLHSHSNRSDGSKTPDEVARIFAASDIRIAALTDHDTLGGANEFIKACKEAGVIGIAGVEFSTVYEGYEVHLLGYKLPTENPICANFLNEHAEYLRYRTEETLNLLGKNGYDVEIDEVYELSGGCPPMSPHIIRVLHGHGRIKDIDEAVKFFWEFLSNKGKAFVPHETRIEKPLEMMREVGAISIVAHPVRLPDPIAELNRLLDLGADGFELYYPEQTGGLFEKLKSVANVRDCIVSGGSDYHGDFHKVSVGEVPIKADEIERFLCAVGIEVQSIRCGESNLDE